jgi:hypothetical protein
VSIPNQFRTKLMKVTRILKNILNKEFEHGDQPLNEKSRGVDWYSFVFPSSAMGHR